MTNTDEIHGFGVNLMLETHRRKNGDTPLDVMDYLWHELHAAILSRRVPPFALYIMKLILAKAPLMDDLEFVEHASKNRRRRDTLHRLLITFKPMLRWRRMRMNL